MNIDADEGRGLVEADWLWTRHGDRIHHATLSQESYEQMADWSHLGVGEPGETIPRHIQLTCGRTVSYVGIPGIFTRMSAPRCTRCCDRLGYPNGHGSPKNDDTCRALMLQRLEVADG